MSTEHNAQQPEVEEVGQGEVFPVLQPLVQLNRRLHLYLETCRLVNTHLDEILTL